MNAGIIITWLLIAFGLAMDAFCVSVSAGICVKNLKFSQCLKTALSFGFFQFLMPVLGWFLGGTFKTLIQGLDHWIAFALLAAIGAKMIKESFDITDATACDDDSTKGKSILDPFTLLKMSIATSIDALAVGISFAVMDEPILEPSLIIGGVTFALCLIGCEFGKRIGTLFERWAERSGGLVLIGIGIKILAEHLINGV